MSVHFIDQIDWSQPWLNPFYTLVAPLLQESDWRSSFNIAAAERNIRNHKGLLIRFVEQKELPLGMAYETFISTSGRVPTRENLHDFFNAMVWLAFPRIKARLNELQSAEIFRAHAAGGVSSTRGPLRDGITIFDENAALLVTLDMQLVSAIREHCWQDAFLINRPSFHERCKVYLFGHALMEKLVFPYKSITAHTWVVGVDPRDAPETAEARHAWIDALVTQGLVFGLRKLDFLPMPVSGVPGWWLQQDDSFYEDQSVFRPKRLVRSH